jgi:hypothetical protein
LHQGSGIPTLEDQRANLEMMNSIFWSLCAETKILEVEDANRLSYCMIQDRLEKLDIHTLLQIRKYYSIAIKARLKWVCIDVKWFDCDNKAVFNEHFLKENTTFLKIFIYRAIYAIKYIKDRYDMSKSKNIMFDKEWNIKIVDMCLHEKGINPLRLLTYDMEGNIFLKDSSAWQNTTNIVAQKVKWYITKTLDIISLLINLLSIEKLILQKRSI